MVAIEELSGESVTPKDEMLTFDFFSPVWSDLVPISQDDGPQPLCPILYDPTCM